MTEQEEPGEQPISTPGKREALTLRLARPEDDVSIVKIHNSQERDSPPQTLERYQKEREDSAANHRGEHYVVTNENRLLGYGSFRWAWWTGRPGNYALEIRVDPHQARQGIGTRLFDRLRSELLLRNATRLVAWVRSDADEGRAFAGRLGFAETGQVIREYRLDVSRANTGAYPALEERLTREGLRFASLSELGWENTAFLRALQQLWADSGDEPPDPDRLRNSFESWRQEVLLAPGLSPETHWVALDGERPVGTTFLKRLSENAYENDYTGVAPSYRGRGIATALKLRAIVWAQQEGEKWFYTSSEIGNTAMITIHTRLGYQPGAQRLEVAYDRF